jgi:hypothetical protein
MYQQQQHFSSSSRLSTVIFVTSLLPSPHALDHEKQCESSGFLFLLRVNWLCAFEVEEVHHVNVVDASFVPRTWCLEVLRDAVLLEFSASEIKRQK